MTTRRRRWTRILSRYRIFTNALALMISAAGSGILGLLYWGIGAHLASPNAIGRAAGEIAAVTLLSTFAQLSFGSVFQRFLPRAAEKSRGLVVTGYATSMVAALAVGVGYLSLGFTRRFFPSSVEWSLLFIVTVVLYTVFALQDSVLISLRVSRWVALENILFGVAKLALLIPLARYALGQGVVLSWTIPLAVTIIAVNWYIFARRLPDHIRTSPVAEPLPTLKRMLSLSIPQFAGTVLSLLSTSVVSLIVIGKLGAVANAHYYLVAQVAFTPSLFIWSISRLLVVEVSHEPDEQRRHIRQSIIAMGAVMFVSVGIGTVFAHQILDVFGSAYADQGTTLLRLLLLSLPGSVVAALYAALAWIDGRVWFLMVREVIALVINLSIVLFLISRHGINSVGYAALITSGVEFALFLPVTMKRIGAVDSGTQESRW